MFDCECNKACKIDEYLNIKKKNCVKKHLFGKSVLACENEILNTTENSLDYENVTCEKTVA